MFALPSSTRIFLATTPTDMRKGTYSLAALATAAGFYVYSGDLFVFLNRRRDRIKILTWHTGGFLVVYKTLERGFFRPLSFDKDQKTVILEPSQLNMLLDGIDLTRVPRPKHWQPPAPQKNARQNRKTRSPFRHDERANTSPI